MTHGTLDPATPLAPAQRVAAAFSGEGQHFLLVDNGSHGFESPTGLGNHCITDHLYRFYLDPLAPPVSCVTEPLDFEGDVALASVYFASSSLWEQGAQAFIGGEAVADYRRRFVEVRRAMERPTILR